MGILRRMVVIFDSDGDEDETWAVVAFGAIPYPAEPAFHRQTSLLWSLNLAPQHPWEAYSTVFPSP